MFRVVLCRFLWCSFSASVQYRETITEHLSIMMCSLLLLFLEWFNVELKPTNWFEWKSIPLSTYLNEVMTGVWWPCATYIGVFILWTTEQWAQINIDHSGDQRWPGLFSLNGWSANTGYCFIKAVCDCVTFIILMRSTQSGYLLFFAGVHSAAWTVTIFDEPLIILLASASHMLYSVFLNSYSFMYF
jgi:hypothetical protein